MQSGPRNRLRVAAANKAAKVKRLKAIQKQPRKGRVNNRMMTNNNTRIVENTVVDARLKLLQKALHKPTQIVDARQKLTKQKDAREKIQERRLHSTGHDVSYWVQYLIMYLVYVTTFYSVHPFIPKR